MQIPAVVAAGDRRAAKAVYGESKVYLEVGGRPLVAHVVAALQRVPEISEVLVVGDAARLGALFDREDLRRELRKPLRVVDQFRNLYENAWESYRRLLPGAGADGRDPGRDDLDRRVLYVSGDLPLITPQEVSQFIRIAAEPDSDYALGLVAEETLACFYPQMPGEPGIRPAYFNLREGRFRQNNLHLVRPGRLGNRYYIEEMYERRYQRQFASIARLGVTLLREERGGPGVLLYYLLMHLAGFFDRHGLVWIADRVRRWIPMQRIERGVSSLLRASFRFAVTELGGCAVDVDTEHDYDAVRERFSDWSKAQVERAERFGPLPLPPGSAQDSRREAP